MAQENELDDQLKYLEKKYDDIKNSKNPVPLTIDYTNKRESIMSRVEKAHQELREYFMKIENRNKSVTPSS